MYNLITLRNVRKGAYTATSPLVFEINPTANDVSFITVVLLVTAVSAGTVTITAHQSWDDGTTWDAVTASGNFTTSGSKVITVTSATLLSPRIRITATAAAGQNFTLNEVRKLSVTPGAIVTSAFNASSSGLATEVTQLLNEGHLATIETDITSIDGKITACDTTGLALETGGNLDTIAGDTTSLDTKITDVATTPISVRLSDGTNFYSLDTSGLALETGGNLDTIAGDTTSIDGKITACDTGNISGTVTANAGTNLNTSLLALETGGNLATIAGDTTSLDSKLPSQGQALMAASVPVVIASNQTAIPVTSTSAGFTRAAAPQLIAGNNIAGSAGAGYAVGGGALASALKAVHCFDTMGKAVGIYDGDPAGAGVLIAITGPGCDAQLNCPIVAGKTVYLRSMEATGGSASDYFVINFLG